MEEKKSTASCSMGRAFGIACLMVITAVVTFLTTVHAIPRARCGPTETRPLGFPRDTPDWSDVDRLEIKEKGIIITRPTFSNRCYLLPLNRTGMDATGLPRPLVILNEALSASMLEHLVGENGAAFCNGYDSFLARELKRDEALRRKREDQQADGPLPAAPGAPTAPGAKAGLQGAAWQGTGVFASSQNQNKQATDVPVDDRHPRCSDVVLDCVDHVGQVQSCYTWVNGAMWMDRKCTDSKQFAIQMTKPPGRVLKIAQQQWVICLQRRSQGLSC